MNSVLEEKKEEKGKYKKIISKYNTELQQKRIELSTNEISKELDLIFGKI